MKHIVILISLFVSTLAYASSLKKEEVELIHNDIKAIYTAFEAGDASVFLNKTYEGIYVLTGGKDNFENILKASISQLATQNARYESLDLGFPEKVYETSKEEICFVPVTTIMEVQDRRFKSVGFMISIRKKGSKEWKYLDGAGMRNDKRALWKIIPDLSKDVEFPDNYIKRL
jgi:hypothetical protein